MSGEGGRGSKRHFKVAAIIAAATVGDGVFALPYAFKQAGWLVGVVYLAVLAAVVIGAHIIYLETLEKNGERKRLLGLAREHLGEGGFWIGFVAVVVGLLLTLVAYLVLGSGFLRLAEPSLAEPAALAIFWAAVSLPVFLSDRRVAELEITGIACTTAVIVFIFASAFPNITFAGAPAMVPANFFLPFGAILFSLAGWTGIEPAVEARMKEPAAAGGASRGVAFGTMFASLLTLMFVVGVLGSAPGVTADTVTGLLGWPIWKRDIVAALGVFAAWTVFMPISRELKNALEKDLGWRPAAARSAIIAIPLLLVALGFNDFFAIVGFVGGVFLSVQYILIVMVGRKALLPSSRARFMFDAIAAVFLLGFVYEAWTFIVH